MSVGQCEEIFVLQTLGFMHIKKADLTKQLYMKYM